MVYPGSLSIVLERSVSSSSNKDFDKLASKVTGGALGAAEYGVRGAITGGAAGTLLFPAIGNTVGTIAGGVGGALYGACKGSKENKNMFRSKDPTSKNLKRFGKAAGSALIGAGGSYAGAYVGGKVLPGLVGLSKNMATGIGSELGHKLASDIRDYTLHGKNNFKKYRS